MASHLPLIGHAITELTSRLPHEVSLEPLVVTGLTALRSAADSYKGNDAGGFTRPARRRIAAALAEVATGDCVPTVGTEPDLRLVRQLVAELAPAGMDAVASLLEAAHRDAFIPASRRPRHGAGHYAAVAAASEYRSSLNSTDSVPDQPELQKFGT